MATHQGCWKCGNVIEGTGVDYVSPRDTHLTFCSAKCRDNYRIDKEATMRSQTQQTRAGDPLAYSLTGKGQRKLHSEIDRLCRKYDVYTTSSNLTARYNAIIAQLDTDPDPESAYDDNAELDDALRAMHKVIDKDQRRQHKAYTPKILLAAELKNRGR